MQCMGAVFPTNFFSSAFSVLSIGDSSIYCAYMTGLNTRQCSTISTFCCGAVQLLFQSNNQHDLTFRSTMLLTLCSRWRSQSPISLASPICFSRKAPLTGPNRTMPSMRQICQCPSLRYNSVLSLSGPPVLIHLRPPHPPHSCCLQHETTRQIGWEGGREQEAHVSDPSAALASASRICRRGIGGRIRSRCWEGWYSVVRIPATEEKPRMHTVRPGETQGGLDPVAHHVGIPPLPHPESGSGKISRYLVCDHKWQTPPVRKPFHLLRHGKDHLRPFQCVHFGQAELSPKQGRHGINHAEPDLPQ